MVRANGSLGLVQLLLLVSATVCLVSAAAPKRQQQETSTTTTTPRRRLTRRSTVAKNGGGGKLNDLPLASQDGDVKISYETKWFTNLVDHFSWANQDTWQQRYLVNRDHWCGQNCPILFYTGNEGDIEVFTNNTGWMWENAEKLHAMLVFAEHRFYGQSWPYRVDPTQMRPDETDKLGYLSSEQALADFAKLVFELKNTIYEAKYSPVIAMGGSYGGMLAAWMRMKYPNLIAGALAGSAPILQFVGEYECQTFNKIVTKDYENYSLNCSTSIAKSWSVLRGMGQSASGLKKLSEAFNTCTTMDKQDVGYLNEMLASIWVNMAMTDYANAATFLSKMPAYPIKHACEQLNADPISLNDEDLARRISLASQVYTNTSGELKCLNIKEYLFDPMDVLWDWQSCTEMVMPICSDGVNDMFEPQPFNVSEQVAGCKTRWGVQTQVNKVRTVYGDKQLTAASNIIFSSCSRDPWSAGCPQESVESRNIYAIKIPGVCHHEDLRPAGPGDSPELKKARQDELNIITDWIQKHYEDLRASTPDDALVWSKRITVV